jgi:hypothetical protein
MSKENGTIQSVDQRRLVSLVVGAINSTHGAMFLDLHPEDYEQEINAAIGKKLDAGHYDESAVKFALGIVFEHHKERLRDAASDDANGGLSRALHSLANKEITGA